MPHNKIAFQGQPGAYSHLTCQQAYPQMEPLPCASFEDAFAAVQNNQAAIAMIPIENSLGGRVADMHHLLPDSRLFVIGEHFLRVQHHLLAVPGATLDTLKTIHSHPQALAQCRSMIRDLGLQPVAAADTAGAAKEVAERGNPSEAAIASSLAGEIYGLVSLRSRIEDKLGNTTRFLVMAPQRSDPPPSTHSLVSLIFQVRSVPAALYKALGGFATNGINVVKLESYITDSAFTVAQFYAEIEGHVAEIHVDRALQELQYFTSMMKIIGCYPASPYRQENSQHRS
jgi:prephenate dehydratase